MATPRTSPAHGPVHVHGDRDGERPFLFHPENDDLFMRTGRQVIEACCLTISVEVWFQELRDMVHHIATWARAHNDRVKACYAVPRNARTIVFVVPASGRFDFDLADLLVELGNHLHRQFNVGTVELHQIPDDEVDRFVDPQHSGTIYGEPRPAHPTVEA